MTKQGEYKVGDEIRWFEPGTKEIKGTIQEVHKNLYKVKWEDKKLAHKYTIDQLDRIIERAEMFNKKKQAIEDHINGLRAFKYALGTKIQTYDGLTGYVVCTDMKEGTHFYNVEFPENLTQSRFTEEEISRMVVNEKNIEIKIPVSGGYIIAERNPDPDYDGITVSFETKEGDVIDIALIECKKENKKDKIDVYTYEDIYSEDWTNKYTLDNQEICKMFKNIEKDEEER